MSLNIFGASTLESMLAICVTGAVCILMAWLFIVEVPVLWRQAIAECRAFFPRRPRVVSSQKQRVELAEWPRQGLVTPIAPSEYRRTLHQSSLHLVTRRQS